MVRNIEITDFGQDMERIDDLYQRYMETQSKQDFLKWAGMETERLRILDEETLHNPDPYYVECVFAQSFLTPEMWDDFIFIARDFLQHEHERLAGYKDLSYLYINARQYEPMELFFRVVLNLMLNAAHQGNVYTRTLFLNLYKTFYKKEYKSLKRVGNCLTMKMLHDLVYENLDERGELEMSCRLILLSGWAGITLDQSIYLVYPALQDMAENYVNENEPIFQLFYDDTEEIHNELKRLFQDEEEMREQRDGFMSFVYHLMDYYELSWDLIERLSPLDKNVERNYRVTLAILKESGCDMGSLTKEQLSVFANVTRCISMFAHAADGFHVMTEIALGIYTEKLEQYSPKMYRPGDTTVFQVKKVEEKKTVKEVAQEEKPDPGQEKLLLKEIEELRLSLHRQETEKKDLLKELREVKAELEEQKRSNHQLGEDRQELYALRNHVYQSTERDIEDHGTVDLKALKEQIRARKVCIIGGHTNWVNKLKSEFPDWIFISPNVSGTVDKGILRGAEHVYFFTDTIGHRTYYRFIQMVRDEKIPFGYIHGVNISKNVQQIAADLSAIRH